HRAELLLEDLLLGLAVLGIDSDLYVRVHLRTHLRIVEQLVERTTVRAPVGAEVDEHRRVPDLLLAHCFFVAARVLVPGRGGIGAGSWRDDQRRRDPDPADDGPASKPERHPRTPPAQAA